MIWIAKIAIITIIVDVRSRRPLRLEERLVARRQQDLLYYFISILSLLLLCCIIIIITTIIMVYVYMCYWFYVIVCFCLFVFSPMFVVIVICVCLLCLLLLCCCIVSYFFGFVFAARPWSWRAAPPTPTRAPDNQLRKMHDQLKYIRDTSLLNFWAWGPVLFLGESLWKFLND